MSQPIPERTKRYVLGRDDWKCRHCGKRETLDPHHVIFRSAGGSNSAKNLLTLCRKCHDDIHDGRLIIEVVALLEYDLTVNFWKQEGWKP
jgi:hypothetical protein